jgi:tetratricopeptide (TPR) repeat protein
LNSADQTTRLRRADQHRQAGRSVDAEVLYREILADEPEHVEANLGLASLLISLGRAPEAVDPLQAAVRVRPEELDARLQLARLLRSLQRNEEALMHYERAALLKPDIAGVWCILGNIYRELVRPEEAERCLLKAIELQPDLPEALNNLGSLYFELGRVEAAVENFQQAIRHRPDYFQAYRNLSVTKKFTELDDEVQIMQLLYIRNAGNEFAVMQLGFALGKVFEDLREPAKAFQYWSAANRSQRKLSPYTVSRDITQMQAMRRIFGAERLAMRDGVSRPDVVPIFVLVMPRSGTSLTEQILASHSAVFGAGELETVRQLAWEAAGGRFPDDLERLVAEDWQALGEKYLDAVGGVAGGRRFVVDKMPRNFEHIGLISMMLRDARIIHCRRDSLDVGLSCFKNHFLGNDLNYSCDLDDLGTYYRHYDALMGHWNRVMPGKIYEMRYEDLVANPAQQIRDLLAWCGIPFEASCLSFHRNRRMVATASATQVRQPIHQGAVQRWKNYEKELEPLKRALERPIDDWP